MAPFDMAVARHTPEMRPRPHRAVEAAARIGLEVAAVHADRVDRDALYPREAIAALAGERLLGCMVPVELGGLGSSLREISAMCTALGRHCANSAMIFAMHQIQVACIVRHGLDDPFFRQFASEALAREQQVLASATTEAGVGGDVRTSMCAVQCEGDFFHLEKNAPVISYGREADCILATARRSPAAASSDQVIALLRKSEYTLDQTGSWDTLGFRGTCSNGFMLRARAATRQILPAPYAEISAQTMLPVSHILWSSVWLGIALDAFSRARGFVRAEARKKPGSVPAGAVRAGQLATLVQLMRANVEDAVRAYQGALADPDSVDMGFAVRMNNLKVSSSELVVRIVSEAMLVCGMGGYRLDSRFSLARHLRDAYGAALMINNDRINGNTAQMLLVWKEE
jgi:acyl-CoA dehydrogenase